MGRVEHIGNATLILGDNRDFMPKREDVDLVLTDPPYGVEFRGEDWDREVPRLAIELPTLYDRCAILMAPKAAWQFPEPEWVACWARPASSSRSLIGGFNHWSPILLYGDVSMPVDFCSYHAIAHSYPSGFGHPSPKPEIVMRWLVEALSSPSETIFDPYAGSGTTGVAAIQLGRHFIGIEVNPDYFALACRRIQEAVNQPDLFVEPPAPPVQEAMAL